MQTVARAHNNAITAIMMWGEVRGGAVGPHNCAMTNAAAACSDKRFVRRHSLGIAGKASCRPSAARPSVITRPVSVTDALCVVSCCCCGPSLLPAEQSFLLSSSMDGTVKIWSPGSSAVEVINPTPEFKYPEEDVPPAGGGRHSYRQQVCICMNVLTVGLPA